MWANSMGEHVRKRFFSRGSLGLLEHVQTHLWHSPFLKRLLLGARMDAALRQREPWRHWPNLKLVDIGLACFGVSQRFSWTLVHRVFGASNLKLMPYEPYTTPTERGDLLAGIALPPFVLLHALTLAGKPVFGSFSVLSKRIIFYPWSCHQLPLLLI